MVQLLSPKFQNLIEECKEKYKCQRQGKCRWVTFCSLPKSEQQCLIHSKVEPHLHVIVVPCAGGVTPFPLGSSAVVIVVMVMLAHFSLGIYAQKGALIFLLNEASPNSLGSTMYYPLYQII